MLIKTMFITKKMIGVLDAFLAISEDLDVQFSPHPPTMLTLQHSAERTTHNPQPPTPPPTQLSI